MVQGIAIRYAVLEEAYAIAELVNSSRPLRGPADLVSPGEIAAMFRAGDFLVLERPDRKLIGAVFLRVGDRVAEVDLLSIAADVDDRNIGQRLVDVAEMVCVARGCRAVEHRFAQTA